MLTCGHEQVDKYCLFGYYSRVLKWSINVPVATLELRKHAHPHTQSRECTIEEREELLGEFLTFVNTLSATHEAMRSVLASDRWFKMLLRIVDIDTTTGLYNCFCSSMCLCTVCVCGGAGANI